MPQNWSWQLIAGLNRGACERGGAQYGINSETHQEVAVGLIDGFWLAASFAVGDRVQTLRGSARGTVVRVLEDGRVVFKSDAANVELTSLPESLRKE